MIKQSIHSSVLSAKLASDFLEKFSFIYFSGGLLLLTGAKACLSSTPGIFYIYQA